VSTASRQVEEEVRDSLLQIEEFVNAVGLSWERDALIVVKRAVLAAIEGSCLACEAKPGDPGLCTADASAHVWARNTAP
jgi:hypothetical protein